MSEPKRGRLAALGLAVGLLLWLWPIGTGGRMPIGGDVSGFSLGIMGELGRAYRAGRLPTWNDLWGFGFPGLAESQMGVYYPPHVVLYSVLATEIAYTFSLVVHTLWGGLGAFWAARRFGASPVGAALGGIAWAASGYFVIHLPHQWGYTVGAWMPWAWGLAWPLARGVGGRRGALALAAVLAIQVLPGHFQLAFITQVSVVLMALYGLVDRQGGWGRTTRGGLLVLAAVVGVAPLAALQLVPTFRLAQLTRSHRDLAYLGEFATTPLHLISYIAPGLFHGSPLWRSVAWVPFHTSPEEHLTYIGLLPLVLALRGWIVGWRRDAGARALGCLAVASVLLSLGPYAPGFEYLVRLPGFGFFRGPARWGVATELALAILAAKGFDRLGDWPRGRAILFGFVIASVVAIGSILTGFEALLAATRGPGPSVMVDTAERMRRALPWDDPVTVRDRFQQIRQPPSDPLVIRYLFEAGRDPLRARLEGERFAIYVRELGPTGALLGLLLIATAGHFPRRRWGPGFVVGFTLIDLVAFGWTLRPVATAPLRPLVEQSPVLARLAEGPGARVESSLANLPMLVGAGTVEAYRTLDRPIRFGNALSLSRSTADGGPHDEWGRWFGVGALLLGPEEPAAVRQAVSQRSGTTETIVDAPLATWSFGRAFAARGPRRSPSYVLWRPKTVPTRAWLIPSSTALDQAILLSRNGEPAAVGRVMREARPLGWRSPRPGELEVELTTDGPTHVIVTVLDDPEWAATLHTRDGEERPVAVEPIFRPDDTRWGGWMHVRLTEPVQGRLRLVYRGRSETRGLAVSAAAWVAWAFWFPWRGPKRTTADATRQAVREAGAPGGPGTE